jgi:DNA-binding GntR family transcriptional regulator
LQRAIRDLILPPGQMVLEQEVSEALRMSRTPVREALVRLGADGLVDLVPRHGFLVMRLVADVLQEIYEIVEGLEGIGVTLTAERITDGGVKALQGLIEASELALARDDLIAWAELDDQFHRTLLHLSGNERLASLAEIYNVHLYRARLFTLHLRPGLSRSIHEHRQLVEYIGHHDARRAIDLYLTHRRRSQNEILTIIRATAGIPPQREPALRTESLVVPVGAVLGSP